MDTDQLRRFVTVVEVGSVTKAAALLRISHGGLSKSVNQLEAELGIQLLTPDGRGITVTDDGKRCYERIKAILAQVQLLNGESQLSNEPSNALTPIRIGTFEVFSTYFFGSLVESIFPKQRFCLRELTPGRIERALLEEKIDIGITYIPVAFPSLDFLKITSFSMGLFAGCKFLKSEYSQLSDLPFAAPSIGIDGPNVQTRGLDGWPEELFPRTIFYDVDMLETGLDLCRNGVAVMYLPTFVVELHNTRASPEKILRKLKLPSGFPSDRREVFLVKRRGTGESAIIKKICKHLRTVCKPT